MFGRANAASASHRMNELRETERLRLALAASGDLVYDWTPGDGAIAYFATVKNATGEVYIVDRSRGILPGAPRMVQAGISLKY